MFVSINNIKTVISNIEKELAKLIKSSTELEKTDDYSIKNLHESLSNKFNELVNKNKDTLILVPANTEVVIPATIKTIEAAAIAGNNVTKSLVIPATVTTIKDFAFANSNIETLDLSNANNASFGNYVFYGCANLTTVNGLNSLDVIKEYMFAFSGLTQLAIADNVVIEYGAFAECDNLTNVTLGNNVTVGQYAFYGSFALESSVVIGSGTIGDYSFADSNINNVIANNVTSVGEGAFMQARNLASISLQNVSELGLYAFYDADKLLTVDISNLTSIAYATFAECDELTTIISSKLSSIGDEAFYGNKYLLKLKVKRRKYLALGALSVVASSLTVFALFLLVDNAFGAKGISDATLIIITLLANYFIVPKAKLK